MATDDDVSSNYVSSKNEPSAEVQDINVAHLCKLARLALDKTQMQQAKADLANIIHMIDVMQAVETQGVEPMAHPLDAIQRLRKDQVTEIVDAEHFQTNAAATAEGYYLVPRVIE